jgi:hypothetical protein
MRLPSSPIDLYEWWRTEMASEGFDIPPWLLLAAREQIVWGKLYRRLRFENAFAQGAATPGPHKTEDSIITEEENKT